jgi:hypothetical protein
MLAGNGKAYDKKAAAHFDAAAPLLQTFDGD